ncbi:hypothetical protein Q6281_29170, partial [Klebsiella pneumoniae]|nr:hypothetical protein [Klebsiella pneumoniae]
MTLKPHAAKHPLLRRLLGMACLATLLIVQPVSAALHVGDQSGLIQAMLHAAGEDKDLPDALVWHPFNA